jgi:hypothetical protein
MKKPMIARPFPETAAGSGITSIGDDEERLPETLKHLSFNFGSQGRGFKVLPDG